MKVDEIVDVVCENRPELKKLFREGADISLYEYYSDTVFVEKSNSKFKKSLINIVKRLAKDREIVIDESVLDQEFSEYFSASTADHHGPLVHSFFYNSTFLETTINDKINKKYIIHLPCAGVSVSNSSYPRGFLFYDEKDHLKKVSLCPISDGRKSIYALKINKKYIEKTLLSLSKDLRSKIEILLPSFSDEKTYEEYITFINFQLWNKITENKQTFITIDQESVVREFLLEHIDADCDIKNLFFKKENLKKYLDIFDGCVGAHDLKRKSGTHFFWYVGDDSREQLWLEGDFLKSENGISIHLDRDTIKENLKNKKIYPNMALSFIILNCFVGLRTDGGFCQINYLKDIQNRFKKYIEIIKMENEIFFPDPSVFRGEFLFEEKQNLKTPINLFLENENNFFENLEKKAKDISMQNGLVFMMDEFYKITTGKYPNKNNI